MLNAATPRRAQKLASRRANLSVAEQRPSPAVQLPSMIYPAPIYQSRYGAWTQVFGSYEERSATGSVSIDCCTTGGPGIPIGLALSERSRSSTIGFLGGFDYTTRGLTRADDGLILGLLTGYESSDFHLTTSSTSSLIPNVGNGAGTLKASLSGPSVGIYGNYFAGPFSADLSFKADFLDIKENFTDNLAFTQNVDNNGNLINTGLNTFSGQASGGLTNLSTFGNLSYRLFSIGQIWVEPTFGFQYTDSIYDGRAKRLLGLDDGYLLMVQGGARFGLDYILANQSRLSTTLTGLVYDDIRVRGGFIQGGVFGTNLLAKSDEGAVRGWGILTVNYDLGNGMNLFAQGDVYGGNNLFGAGGKGGVRVQW
jgi:hypothetical protein